MSSETVTREDQKILTPVGGQIEFVPPFGRQVPIYQLFFFFFRTFSIILQYVYLKHGYIEFLNVLTEIHNNNNLI